MAAVSLHSHQTGGGRQESEQKGDTLGFVEPSRYGTMDSGPVPMVASPFFLFLPHQNKRGATGSRPIGAFPVVHSDGIRHVVAMDEGLDVTICDFVSKIRVPIHPVQHVIRLISHLAYHERL